MKTLSFILIATAAQVMARPTLACTTFNIPQSDEKIVANNLDWTHDNGQVIVNPRNLRKTAAVIDPSLKPLTWIAKFGSLTFNQVGREFPYGGMNENGLVVENMWLDQSAYPTHNLLPAVNEVQWIQFQLDMAATTQEAIALAQTVQLTSGFAPIHYLICDATGECATFESLAGKMVIHSGGEMVVNSLTNDDYRSSLSYLRNFSGFGGNQGLPSGEGSLDRFVRAAVGSRAYSTNMSTSAFDHAVNVLMDVAESSTVWNLIYEPVARRVSFRTRNARSFKTISFVGLDFSCSHPSKAIDINSSKVGSVNAELKEYTPELNAQNIDKGTFLPEAIRTMLKAYPSRATHCLD